MKAKKKDINPRDIPFGREMVQLQDRVIRGCGCGFVGVRHVGRGAVRLTIESEWDADMPVSGMTLHGNFAKIHLTEEAIDELIAALLASKRNCIEDRA